MKRVEIEGSKILLVEDEENLAIGLEYNLLEEGYQVVRVADGKQALACFTQQEFDLIILDVMLPFFDGFEVAKRIRVLSAQIPILMLTARTAPEDKIRGLGIGADDYLSKPFHLEELFLRVQGMLKRKMWYKKNIDSKVIYRFGQNEIDFSDLTCIAEKRRIRLTPLEAILLKFLIDNSNHVVSREELLENVWQTASDMETRTVDNFILRLRKYFEPDPAHPKYFKNIRGAGYKFVPD